MSRTRIQEIVMLTREGWRPYDAEPDRSVYERLGCPHFLRGRRKPFWFVRDDVFCCIGCADHCTLKRPAGFPLPLVSRPGGEICEDREIKDKPRAGTVRGLLFG